MLAALSTLDIRELIGVSPTPVDSTLESVRGSPPWPAPPVVSSVACDARRDNTSLASSSRSSWLSGLRKAGAGRFAGLGVSSLSVAGKGARTHLTRLTLPPAAADGGYRVLFD
ncbi:unnamed protein product [Arctogadus glacialis]